MRIADFSTLEMRGDFGDLTEQRFAYNGSSQTEYVGLTQVPNAGTDQAVWYLLKYNYSGGALAHIQLPDNGATFTYTWDDRATSFS